MHQKSSLRADFCRSRATEEPSEKNWIMIELSHNPQIVSHNPGITPLVASFRANRQGQVCGLGNLVPPARKSIFPRPSFLFSPTL